MKNYKNLALVRTVTLLGIAAFCFFLIVPETSAQGTRRKRNKTSSTASTLPVSGSGEAQIVSRAEDFPDTAALQLPKNDDKKSDTAFDPNESSKLIEDLRARVAGLEGSKKNDKDDKQKRLLLNLDILNRAEQRSESLRKQLFEMIEKESTIKTKLDIIETNIRPEAIEREVAFAGSLRPEALRDLKKRQLEIERTNLQAVLVEVQRTKTSLDQNLRRSEELVEKLRVKFEKEIDDALADDPQQ